MLCRGRQPRATGQKLADHALLVRREVQHRGNDLEQLARLAVSFINIAVRECKVLPINTCLVCARGHVFENNVLEIFKVDLPSGPDGQGGG